MADIYIKATRVIIWLGLVLEDSSMAIAFFNTICSKIAVNWQTYLLRPISTDTWWADVIVPVQLDQA
jgi:hypothetical protein